MKKFIISGFLTFLFLLFCVSITLVVTFPTNPEIRMVVVALFSMIAGPYFSFEDEEKKEDEEE